MTVVERNKIISLTYELRLNDAEGKVVESLNEQSPLTFLFGSGRLLPKFETNIEGLKAGDIFDFHLSCEEAYGQINKDAIVDVPKQAFEINGKIDHNLLKTGNVIPMQDSSGNRLNGTVTENNNEICSLAGKLRRSENLPTKNFSMVMFIIQEDVVAAVVIHPVERRVVSVADLVH